MDFSNFFSKSILPFYCDQDSQKYVEIIWTKLNVETDLGQVWDVRVGAAFQIEVSKNNGTRMLGDI